MGSDQRRRQWVELRCEHEVFHASRDVRHDWLGNGVLFLTPETVIAGRRDQRARAELEEMIGVDRTAREVRRVRSVASGLDEATRMSRLVTPTSLPGLTVSQLATVTVVLDRISRREVVLEAIGAALIEALDAFEKAVAEFWGAWSVEDSGDESVGGAFESVMKTGGALHAALLELPKGVIIP